MRLSVVIVNWNSRDDLIQCLDSLSRQTVRDQLEILVVDHASSDGSAQAVRTHHPDVHLIETGANLGFAEGCNRGIEQSRGEWVAMLNNDAVAEPDWAEALLNAADHAPAECGMLQSLLLFLDDPLRINSTGIVPTWEGSGYDRHGSQARSECPPSGEIFCPTAGAAAYRRSMLDHLKLRSGWLDRSYFMYLEDLDLGWRARLAGYTAIFVPDSCVLHKHHGSSHRHGHDWLAAISRVNRIRTILKNASLRFLMETSRHQHRDFIAIARHGGWSSILSLLRAIPSSLVSRREVTARLKRRRREVEQQWMR